MNLLSQVVVNAIALWLLDLLMAGVQVGPPPTTVGELVQDSTLQRVIVYLLIGAVLALVNAIVRPVIKVVAFPIYILTLGFFSLVVNVVLLMLVSRISAALGFGLQIDSLLTAAIASLVLSILTALVAIPFKAQAKHKR